MMKNMYPNTKVRWYESRHKTGKIIGRSRQGDEVVIVEWDKDFTVSTVNVNDLIVLETDDRVL